MSWKASERLIDLSRRRLDVRDPRDDGGAAVTYDLPDDERATAIRSRQVFDELAKAPMDDADGEPELKTSLMETAMVQCGLKNGKKYAAMFVLSKWAKMRDEPASLNLAEFQAVIERFSSPVRIRNRMRRKVDKYMAHHGFQFANTVDEFTELDYIDACVPRAPSTPVKMDGTIVARSKTWNEILNEPADPEL
ncbi:Hypothetical protein CINCED_3A018861 [Cinara cedri]|uniref:Uncharacterized protein n=1 Tax=Cinara cedri TaxID=506608 RepID=A0A5E4LZM3_9HEMI|nr:Hypothetical protein CINCED_3A018861 [Cinara cedri]